MATLIVPRESLVATPRASDRLIVAVIAAAFVLSRPNIFGEQAQSLGLAAAVAAGVLVLGADRGTAKISRSSVALIALSAAATVWLLLRAVEIGSNLGSLVNGHVALFAVLIVTAFTVGKRVRALLLGRVFVVTTALLSASAIVTLLLRLAGVSLELMSFPIGTWTATLQAPFTPVVGVQTVLGVEFPRFTGFAREPGWMAMYSAVAWFVWPHVMRPGRWSTIGRLAILGGVIAPWSTAGFGVFVVVFAYEMFLRPRPIANAAVAYGRVLLGLAFVAAAIWVAFYAPVLGLNAKATQNELSLSERNASTSAGLDALANLSLGGATNSSNAGINLIASIAQYGWPYSLLVALAVIVPALLAVDRRVASAPMLVVLLTFVLAQPATYSIGPFVLLLVVNAVEPVTRLQTAGDGLDSATATRRRHRRTRPVSR